MPGYPCAPVFHVTGRYRLRPEGARVILQLEERTSAPHPDPVRWRDATPQDVMNLIAVDVSPTTLKVGLGA
ncbi:hypothetical protein [Methylobacterium sp. WSM2598]|uniref:hypothetical protein n=1 Tax=Methylobacterium sp. WSM2598 TaxID=398261 RepID=UPI000360C37A|nr:hypothetical protein [Methylobacterium sp. WSM2598]